MIKDYVHADLFEQNSIDKQIIIEYDGGTITNEILHQEQFELTESICSESELRFGGCEASCVKFRVQNIVAPLKGKNITIKMVLGNDYNNPFQIGQYKVESDELTADRRFRDITAYDALYDIINTNFADWYDVLPFPITLKNFRTRFFAYFGLQQENVTLINDDMTIEKTVSASDLSGKTVLTCICELNGCFGKIGRDGIFHYVFLDAGIQGLYPREDLYPSDTLYPHNPKSRNIGKGLYIECHYKDYVVRGIDKIQVRQSENDIGAVVGSGDNCYIVQDNFLVYGKDSESLENIARRLLGKIIGLEYRPFDAKILGNPCIETGDSIRLNTKYELVETYIFTRTLTGIQALRDSFSSAGEEYYSEKVNSVNRSIEQLRGKTNELVRTVEETRSTITNVEQDLQSEIRQTAESITSTVASAQKKYDESKLTIPITYYGYGNPQNIYPASNDYYLKQYLDQETGYVYRCLSPTGNTFYWKKVEELEPIIDEVYSKIEQTQKEILSTISGSEQIWIPEEDNGAEIFIDFSGYIYPPEIDRNEFDKLAEKALEDNRPDIKYLNQTTGIVYSATMWIDNAPNWMQYKQLTSVKQNLSTRIDQTVKSIKLEVESGSTTAGITITIENADGTTSNLAGTINMTGLVTFFDLSQSGKTTINGANITTGSINCDRLNGGTIQGQAIEGGTISGSQINAKDIYCVNHLYMKDDSNEIAGASNVLQMIYDKLPGVSFIGENTSQEILYIARSVIGSVVFGSNVAFRKTVDINSLFVTTGKINSDTNITIKGDYVRLDATSGSENEPPTTTAAILLTQGEFRPQASYKDVIDLGASAYKWKTIYATTGTINTSDRDKKTDIFPISEKYEQLFELIEGVTYRFKNESKSENHDRIHIGAISQQIEESMEKVGIEPEELAFFCKDKKKNIYTIKKKDKDGNEYEEEVEEEVDGYDYSLRYSEWIMMNTHMIQKTRKEYKKLQKNHDELQIKYEELQNEISVLKTLVNLLLERG